MSTASVRTRSLRKPAAAASQYERSTAGAPTDELTRERGNQSPTRLPKPSSSITAPALAPASFSRTTTVSRPGTSTSNASTRAPSQRSTTSRPPLTSDNKTASLRGGARTPIDLNSSIQHNPTTRHSRNSSTGAVLTNSRPPVTQSRTRTTSNAPLLVPATASTIIRPPSSASTQSSHQENKLNRPAFSILQQHFSPAKSLAPKPPTASFLAPPSPSKLPSNVLISAETSRLQTELLQLHLLHQSSSSLSTQFRNSAKRKLQVRFEDVVRKHTELVELEAEERDRINAMALKAWADGGGVGWGLDEKVQVLDQVLMGVWNLGEAGGKYLRVVKRFERWVGGVRDILEARGLEDEDLRFIEGLDGDWKDECQVLSRKLEGWRDQLRHLGELDGKSSLSAVVRGVGDLVSGMLAEVQVMGRVECQVIAREEEWIREVIDDGSEEADTDSTVPGAVWRTC